MRGMLKQRYKGSWSLVIDDYQTDPVTGARVRKRKWITFHGTRKQAETKQSQKQSVNGRGRAAEG